MNEDPAAVITVTAEERTEVEAVLRRRDLPPRLRERLEMVKAAALGQDVAAIARWSGRTPETVRRWLAVFRGGWHRRAGRRSPSGATPESRCDVSGRAGTGGGDAAADAGTALRCLDLPSPQRLSHAADRHPHRPRLAAGAAARSSTLSVAGPNTPSLISKTRPKSPPAQAALQAAGEKGAGGSRSGTSCTMRTRPTWTPTPP